MLELESEKKPRIKKQLILLLVFLFIASFSTGCTKKESPTLNIRPVIEKPIKHKSSDNNESGQGQAVKRKTKNESTSAQSSDNQFESDSAPTKPQAKTPSKNTVNNLSPQATQPASGVGPTPGSDSGVQKPVPQSGLTEPATTKPSQAPPPAAEIDAAPTLAETGDPDADAGSEARYVGSYKTSIFHRINCSMVANIPENDRVYFPGLDEAFDIGYDPCSSCRPTQ